MSKAPPPPPRSQRLLLPADFFQQGIQDSLPEPNVVLEEKIQASEKKVANLTQQLTKMTGGLAEAQAQLKERAENKRVVDSAKATAAQLVVRRCFALLERATP